MTLRVWLLTSSVLMRLPELAAALELLLNMDRSSERLTLVYNDFIV
jgi:hypothetical protein